MPTVDPPAILINGETRAILSARDRGLQRRDGSLESSTRKVILTNA